MHGPDVEVTHSVDSGLYEQLGIGNAATAKLTLYSPLQVDVIDRNSQGRAIPLEAAGSDRAEEYLDRIMSTFRTLQPQEDARDVFTAPR